MQLNARSHERSVNIVLLGVVLIACMIGSSCGHDHAPQDQANTDLDPELCGEGFVLVDAVCLPDSDGDGQPNGDDNCPSVSNPDQQDDNNNGIGDQCEDENGELDTDADTVPDKDDNCPEHANQTQSDHDHDGQGDACEFQNGSPETPFIISVSQNNTIFQHSADTSQSDFDLIDVYPAYTQDESGPEYYYVFSVPSRMNVKAWIDSPEPVGVDVDVHLLDSLDPISVIDRGHHEAKGQVEPGALYYLVLDSYGGDSHAGPYRLHVEITRWFTGTPTDPVPLGGIDVPVNKPVSLPLVFVDQRSTLAAESDSVDAYPPDSHDESGPEVVYGFTIAQAVYFAAELLLPEPNGVDIDLHLLSAISPAPNLIERHNHKILTALDPGTYFVVADTNDGDDKAGDYVINISLRSQDPDPTSLFADYLVQATSWIYENFGLLGYDIGSVLTHDIDYGAYGVIEQTGIPEKTMCVAAVMEVILVAMQLYEQDTDDETVWDYLPIDSFRKLDAANLKAHLWVNYGDIDSGGSADALRHFGMGMNTPFEKLVPGSLVNINRSNGTGHAVIFLAFLDQDGHEYASYPDPSAGIEIIGFKYFSSQGSATPGAGGMDYRWAIFEKYGCPPMPGPRDCKILYDTKQHLLNCGVMYHPTHWRTAYYTLLPSLRSQQESRQAQITMPWQMPGAAPKQFFQGWTTDD